MVSDVKHTHAITLLTIFFLCMSFPVFAADPRLQFSSETTLYSFERENQQGNSIQSMPLYEYMRLGTMGISYKKVSDDGDTVENTAGLDTYPMVTGFLTCQGLSSWNFESRGWREHTYEAVLVLDEFLLKAMYQAYRFDDYFSEDDTGSQPFRYLKDTDEKVSVVGGDMVWQQSGIVDVGIKLKQYTYDVRDETSRNVTAVLNVHGDKNSQAGLEIGIMDGETSENEYTLMRGYFYWDTPLPITENWYVSGNLLYVRYDQDIYGEDSSLFMSLGGGKQVIENSLQLNVSGDYSSDPYFDKDFRLMIALKYDY